MASTRLNFLPYLQEWDGTNLQVRLLAIPRNSPLDPLIDGLTPPGPSFATAHFTFSVHLVQGLGAIPITGTPTTNVVVTPPFPAQAEGLFNDLATVFTIDPAPAPAKPRQAGRQILKYLPPTYRDAIGFSGHRSPLTFSDDTYRCLLRSGAAKPPYQKIKPQDNPKYAWGKVIAMALRQPVLAEALGMIVPLTIPVPADFFKQGGWLYVTLDAASDGFGLTTIPDALKIYSTRIPPLSAARPLFSPILFPVASAVPPGPYDDIFQEVEDYNDGFAKAVHGIQPQFLDPLNETEDGTRPAKDIGVRLGWDDEQVTIWLHRQVDPGAVALDAPLGVAGYRVDARVEGSGAWASLCQVTSAVKVGATAVGSFAGELNVEAIPAQPDGDILGDYWLPSYYTHWTGPSLVAVDTVARQLIGDPNFAGPYPVTGVAPSVALEYGKTYQFRVRLADHTGGGPVSADAPGVSGPSPTFTIPFRRWIRPRAVKVVEKLPNVPDPTSPPTQVHLLRPLLGYPEYVFTGAPNAVADLIADIPAASAVEREVGLPDPDVAAVQITVEVRALGLDEQAGGGTDVGYHPVYTTTRPFPDDPTAPLELDLDWIDVAEVDTLAPAPTTGPLPMPTARDIRLVFTSLGRDDPQGRYFGAADVLVGASVDINVRHESADERALFASATPGDMLRAIFLQPSALLDAATASAQQTAGLGVQAPGNPIGRLADELQLAVNGLCIRGRKGRRTVFGASGAMRHILAPDNSNVTFASNTDLTHHWIIVLRLTIARDWTWGGLAATGVSVQRDGVEVGRIEPRFTVNADALIHPTRTATDLVFFDVVDPKPDAGQFPAELTLNYTLTPTFVAPPTKVDAPLTLSVELPITTPPSQVPKLVSAGIALSNYVRSANYASTDSRRRALWLEFDRPPDNPRDGFFGRILAYAPDPVLSEFIGDPDETAEPPLPIDPELIRTIIPGQSDDGAGLTAMDALIASDSPVHFLLPLPPGIPSDAPELFGFYTYEFRTGHAQGWSTAQGRFGTPLRVTGVQHPAPPLTCMAVHTQVGISASAPFATPVQNGRSVRRFPPATEIYVMLYAQVHQSDGADFRNVLLGRKPARFKESRLNFRSTPDAFYGNATWSTSEVRLLLASLTLDADTPLSCLAVETLPGGNPFPDPLGAGLGNERLLRTSPLIPIPEICAVS
ncbi:MAG: hypothetical protein JWL77_3535 [Chthonomonadaceae bacterium]|nr:hypothetical protein [Chthonomonadaceae bacterium]